MCIGGAAGALLLTKALRAQEVAGGQPATPGLKAGETVTKSGVYNVTHDKLDGHDHAHPHPVIAMRGTVLPPCRLCKNGVTYSLILAAEDVKAHDLFKTS
jgi:hypothetical protein